MTTYPTYAELERAVAARRLSICPDHRAAPHPRDLHGGKPVSIRRDDDTGALEIYRHDDALDSTMIGRLA